MRCWPTSPTTCISLNPRRTSSLGVVDLQKSASEASFVAKALRKFGLPSDIGAAIAALASGIRDHRHLETLLTSCDPEERQMLYDSCLPHLRFTAKPLDVYVASAGRMAERLQLPVIGRNGELLEFRPAHDVSSLEKAAQQALANDLAKRTLTLLCAKCTRQQCFVAVGDETHVDVVLKARKAGWVYDHIAQPPHEICPKCPTSLRPNA